ncbi:MAG: aminomethyl-transferring glycine dehydrogenase subunit GcvPA [Christensenellales bacterium]
MKTNKYIPNTPDQQQDMLKATGYNSAEELFAAVPEKVRLKEKLNLPEALSEMELTGRLKKMAGVNSSTDNLACFLGAGAYDHFIPAVVGNLLKRQEFYTAYTPYQPEISQGTLQAIFEYQSMICELTGMDVANASMYDGASALAEAALMACRATRRDEVVVAHNVHPQGREVLKTYARFNHIKVIETPCQNGLADMAGIENALSENTAAVIVQSPNFFGIIEDLNWIADRAHGNKSLLIVSCDPVALALLKSPGETGADIVVGEGQALGNPLNFGGPYLGFFAAKQELLRKMPGRIVGQTTDKQGRRGFVLTIQTREQHIRREKATSNICSNQALNALTATIYLTALGKQGLREVAVLCAQKARYAYDQLIKTGCFTPAFDAPFFKEFAVRYKGDVEKLNDYLLCHHILGGYDLGRSYPALDHTWLVAVTEKRTKQEIDTFAGKAAEL